MSKLIDHSGIWFDLTGLPNHANKRHNESYIKDKGGYYSAVTAACCLIKKELFNACDGFDTTYLNGYEDVDLCLKLKKMGFRHWVCHDSRILHHVSSSEGRTHHNNQNIQYFLRKWADDTCKIGQKEWPPYYIERCIRDPLKLNFHKLIDACLRQLKLRSGDSEWAKNKRAKYISTERNK